MNDGRKTFLIPYLILIALVLLRFLGLLFPEARLWGFNHLQYNTIEYTLGFAVMAILIALFPFISPVNKIINGLIERTAEAVFESKGKYYYRLAFAIACGALFMLLRAPTHFMGDGYTLIANFSGVNPPLMKWTEAGTIFMVWKFFELFDVHTKEAVINVFQVISVIAGMASVMILFAVAEKAIEDRMGRFLTLLTFLSSGIMLFFFGYIEYYPLTWPFMLGFIYFSLKSIKGEGAFWPVIVVFVIGILLHMQQIYFLPALAYVFLHTRTVHRWYERNRRNIHLALGLACIIFIILFAIKYKNDIYFQDIFLTPFKGKPLDTSYAIFSSKHIFDVINELLLLFPLLPLFLYLASGNYRHIIKRREPAFLGIAFLFWFLPLMVIDPKLGLARDWDLFSFTAFPLGLLLVILSLPKFREFKDKLLPSIFLFALIAPVPFLLTNLKTDSSVEYIHYFYDLDQKRSHPTLRLMYVYYVDTGQQAKADSLGTIYHKEFPNMTRMDNANSYLRQGNVSAATSFVNAVIPDKYDPDYHAMKGRYFSRTGNLPRALASFDSTITLRSYNAAYYYERSMIHVGMKRYDDGLKDLRKGLSLAPESPLILNGLADLHLIAGNYDSTIYFGERLIAVDSSKPIGYFFKSKAYAMLGNKPNAIECAREFLEKSGDDTVMVRFQHELARLIQKME